MNYDIYIQMVLLKETLVKEGMEMESVKKNLQQRILV
jgi:hypothetical protein